MEHKDSIKFPHVTEDSSLHKENIIFIFTKKNIEEHMVTGISSMNYFSYMKNAGHFIDMTNYPKEEGRKGRSQIPQVREIRRKLSKIKINVFVVRVTMRLVMNL